MEEAEEGVVKPTRSFRYEDYNTRRVFLRSYPLQWDWPDGQDGLKQQVDAADNDNADEGSSCGSRRWTAVRRKVAAAMVEWGEGKMLLLRRVKKRLALYLLGCHYRPGLPFKSGGSSSTMLTSR